MIRGRLTENAVLAPYTWFRVGGPVERLFSPADPEDLRDFLRDTDGPILPVGVGSNLLVRDGGVEGSVVRLGRGFNAISVEGTRVRAGAAALDARVAKAAAEAGIAGLEFFRGVPGTVGGAVRMNAGCYGTETKDRLVEATVIRRDGSIGTLTNAALGFAYRHSDLPDDAIVIEAVFEGTKDEPEAVLNRMKTLMARREETQPIREKTGGSTFRNPPGENAWRLIDAAGGRGLRVGGAVMSEKHCNFMINTGEATAADLEGLGEEIRHRVADRSGHDLHWEIKRVGQMDQNNDGRRE